jgi:hypothetical protein
VAHRRHDTEEVTVKDVLKDFQDNNIDVNRLENSGHISASTQKSQEIKEEPQKDNGAGNGRQTSEIFKHSEKLNIFFAINRLCQN